jgi:hypothetical protein
VVIAKKSMEEVLVPVAEIVPARRYRMGAVELPFPVAQVAEENVASDGRVARTMNQGEPLFQLLSERCMMPCYFQIKHPWAEAEAGINIKTRVARAAARRGK